MARRDGKRLSSITLIVTSSLTVILEVKEMAVGARGGGRSWIGR
jgi:hypothetical protein